MSRLGSDWRDDAACRDTDPEAFFPSIGEPNTSAKRVCAGCGVRGECLDHALTSGEHFGVWGGLSEHERRSMRRAGRAS
jgi:WhiB family redox-sensing transcriptional regulator